MIQLCPQCNSNLQQDDSPNKKFLSVCSNDDHYFVYNNRDNFWLLRVPTNNIFAYVGYDGNYFTMVVKGPNEKETINIIEPFEIKDSPIILKRYIKLISFL